MAAKEYPLTEIFVGPAESGKTRAAMMIAEGKKCRFIDGRKFAKADFIGLNRMFHGADGDEELIIIDDLSVKALDKLLLVLMPKEMTIDPKGRKPYKYIRPRTIITVDAEKYDMRGDATYTRRYSVVRFPESAPLEWGLMQEGGEAK